MKKSDGSVGAVVLAAGESKRFGSPKQMLKYRGKELICNAVENARASRCARVVVVLGACAEEVDRAVRRYGVKRVINEKWREGMASSIGVGIDAVADMDAALIMTCDQPYVISVLLDKMISTYEVSSSNIVACEYAGTVGVPALFDCAFFDELTDLKGDAGAKMLINKHIDQVASIPFEKGGIDIDTMRDTSIL
jgi:molybdenum cofactor cytidylyltransferase